MSGLQEIGTEQLYVIGKNGFLGSSHRLFGMDGVGECRTGFVWFFVYHIREGSS